MTGRETLKTIREGILSGKCSDGNLAWIVNLCDESLAESGSTNAVNAAAMCKALKYTVSLLRSDTFVVLNLPATEIIAKILLASEAALSAPARQCDVGTADEQMKRQYDTMCNTTNACPDSDWSCRKCFAQWAQSPYSESNGVK